MLYPLIFNPIVKAHPWGGRQLHDLYGKPLPAEGNFGESWEISDRPEGVSVIANGPLAGKDLRWLMENHAGDLLGQAQPSNGRFPLLVKILDCREAPSIQVHPPAAVAARTGGEPKTELWYVTHAEPDAELFVGLRPGTKRAQFERRIADGSLADALHRVPVRPGDAMFVPSGRVHAIGGGTTVFEIQQNSNTTYRVFDWNRKDASGKPRELHVQSALESIDFDDVRPGLVAEAWTEEDKVRRRSLARNDTFGIEERQVGAGYRFEVGTLDRPLTIGVAQGELEVHSEASGIHFQLGPGQFCLIPAVVKDAVLTAGRAATFLVAAPAVVEQAQQVGQRLANSAAAPAWQSYELPRRRVDPSERKPSLPSRRMVKRNLTRRLIYSPFLKMLVLLFWFRVVVLGMAAVLVAGVIMVPRLWVVTPPGFLPRVKVSLLDKVQAAMLKRSAERAMARQDYDGAYDAWRNAFGNNQGDPDLTRGLIRCIMAPDPMVENRLPIGVQAADWLLRLTQTNRTDVELVTSFYDKAQLYELAGLLLGPLTQDSMVISTNDLVNPVALADRLRVASREVDALVLDRFPGSAKAALTSPQALGAKAATEILLKGLNGVIDGLPLYQTQVFANITLRPDTRQLLATNPRDDGLKRLNRMLLEDAYPNDLRRMFEFSSRMKAAYVKALFFSSEFDEYDRLWRQLTPAEQSTPDMQLIRAGYVTGWSKAGALSDGNDVGKARETIAAAADQGSGPLWVLANRLQMAVSSSRLDAKGYLEALQRLKAAQVDNAVDNASYWMLLANTGRKAEAVTLARDYATPPRASYELVQLARINVLLGTKDVAVKIMRAFANAFPLSESVWTMYASLLLDDKDWEGLRGAALHMRQFPIFRGSLDALANYYEGRADLATGRLEAADQAFRQAGLSDFRTPGQAMVAAGALLTLEHGDQRGYPAAARAILERAHGMVTNNLQYLELLTKAADQLRDGELLLESTRAAYELAPNNPDVLMRYSGALLVMNKQPGLAITITGQLLERFPNSSAVKINRALAFLYNYRANEAKAVLDTIDESRLRSEERNSYKQALFEYYYMKQDYEAARGALKEITMEALYPLEQQRLRAMVDKLPAPKTTGPKPTA